MNTRLIKSYMLAVALVLCSGGVVRAADAGVFTADLPFDADQKLPTWMHGPPLSAPGDAPRLAFRLSPPAGRDLLLNVVFDETETGELRVEWLRDGQSSPEVVAENLGEGLGVPNQRHLLISAARLGGNGTLLLQGGENLNVKRVKFEWVSERTMLASASRYVPVVVTASRLTLAETDVDGGPRPMLQDEWRDRIVRAVLTEKAEPISPSIELVATLEQAPTVSRLEASIAGAYLDQEIWLVVNNHEIGPIAIDVPTLEDPGHLAGEPGKETLYAGWRRASIWVPAALLLPGENSILLELRSPLNAGYRNRAFVRDAVLELSFPAPVREPDLTLPVMDLPSSLPDSTMATPETAPSPGNALMNFWQQGGGSL